MQTYYSTRSGGDSPDRENVAQRQKALFSEKIPRPPLGSALSVVLHFYVILSEAKTRKSAQKGNGYA